MPTRFETIQYNASPISKLSVNTPNIRGIIHSMIIWVCCCCGDVETAGVIFCISHIDPPTNTGSRIGIVSWLAYCARSIQRKELSSGTTPCTSGSHEYRLPPRSARRSGVDGNVARRDQNRPKKIGICMTKGPRHPRGLTLCSL